jgi:hypothetical protein
VVASNAGLSEPMGPEGETIAPLPPAPHDFDRLGPVYSSNIAMLNTRPSLRIFLRPCQIVSPPLASPSFLFYELKVENIIEL